MKYAKSLIAIVLLSFVFVFPSFARNSGLMGNSGDWNGRWEDRRNTMQDRRDDLSNRWEDRRNHMQDRWNDQRDNMRDRWNGHQGYQGMGNGGGGHRGGGNRGGMRH